MKTTLAIALMLLGALTAHAQSLLGILPDTHGKLQGELASGFDPHHDAPAFDNWGGPGNPGYCMGMSYFTKLYYVRVRLPGLRAVSRLEPARELIKRVVPLAMARNLGPGVGEASQRHADWSRDMEGLERFIRSGSPALISATFADGRAGGHALLAYRVTRYENACVIHVYDPNLGSQPETWDRCTLVYDRVKKTLAYGAGYPEGYTFGFDNFHFVEQENVSTLVLKALDALKRQGS
jgi:hypothetical protein